MSSPLLSVEDLEKHYPITEGLLSRQTGSVRAVDGISFEVRRGETVGIVGESGCGKSTAVRSLLRLEEPTAGTVRFEGEELGSLDGAALDRFRRRATMVFQDPSSSFDPRMSVGESVAEPLRIHGLSDRAVRRGIVGDLLDRVGLARDDAARYPHEFSGGQKQRIAIARALAVNPDLVVADEPVSALDVSVQAEILALLESLQEEFGLSFLLISHDLGVVRQICDRVLVMYVGEIVERGPTEQLFQRPLHPYTEALLESIPRPDPDRTTDSAPLSGTVPDPANPPSGCRFHPRCPKIIQPDTIELPPAEWRSIVDLRLRLRGDPIDLRGMVGRHEQTSVDAEPLAPEVVGSAVRAEFDLPARLADRPAERALTEAIELLSEGHIEAATERLEETFASICERRTPVSPESGRGAACFLSPDAEGG